MANQVHFTERDRMVLDGRCQSALKKLLDSSVSWKVGSVCVGMVLRHENHDYIVIKKVFEGRVWYCNLFQDECRELNPSKLKEFGVVFDPRGEL